MSASICSAYQVCDYILVQGSISETEVMKLLKVSGGSQRIFLGVNVVSSRDRLDGCVSMRSKP